MIPHSHIIHWSSGAPWPSELQVEQDLILSRLIVEIADDPLLGDELALRGGTCLHKLHLPTALRYSEDLDYVRKTSTPGGPLIDALRRITAAIGLDEQHRKLKRDMITYICQAPGEAGGTIRIKIETNTTETACFLPRIELPYSVRSPWFEGAAQVSTFSLNELMATKTRALYQRSKGRDLFDLWHVLLACDVDDAAIAAGLSHYMKDDIFTFPQLAQNLKAKLVDPELARDLDALITGVPSGYTVEAAADLVMERIGRHLRNAPTPDEIRNGSWRR